MFQITITNYISATKLFGLVQILCIKKAEFLSLSEEGAILLQINCLRQKYNLYLLLNIIFFLICLDTEKQNAINLFLGLFVPNENELAIWEQNFDYYLHHPEATNFIPSNRLVVCQNHNFC